MNDSLYDEYMRSVLGYQPADHRNTYDMNYDNYMPVSSNIPNFSNMQNVSNMQDEELEKCYPEIYRLVYPMVKKACSQNTRPMTRELVDSMTNEIYFSIEDNELAGSRKSGEENRSTTSSSSKSTNTVSSSSTNSTSKVLENRTEDRQRIRNPFLNDLIRILILRELLGRPGFPAFPGRPPRPPMRPPRPPMRPPMGPPRPRSGVESYNSFNDEYNDIFEY